MDNSKRDIRNKFVESLMTLVDRGIDVLDEEAVAEVLWESLVDLDPATYRFSARYAEPGGTPTLTLCYHTWIALQHDLEELLEKRGLMVQLDDSPPLLETLDIAVTTDAVDMQVNLCGRAVHHSNEGVAIELFSSDDTQRQALQDLVEATERATGAGAGAGSLASTFTSGATIPPPAGEQPDESSEPEEAIPVVDQLIEHSEQPDDRWQLERVDVGDVLLELTDTEDYGVLEVQTDSGETIQYVIHYGRLVDVRYDPPRDTEQQLIHRMITTGVVDREDVDRAEVLASIHDIPLQDALIDMGCITLEQLLDAIEDQLIDDLFKLWEIDAPEGRFYQLEDRPSLRLRRSAVELQQQVERYRSHSADAFDCQVSDVGGTCRLTLDFETPSALRRNIKNLVEDRGLMVELHEQIPLMEPLDIAVTAEAVDQQVHLGGRAVHRANREVALQLFPAEQKQRQQLQQLLEAMHRAGEAPGPVDDGPSSATVALGEPAGDDSEPAIPAVDRMIDHPGRPDRTWQLDSTDTGEILLELAGVDGYAFVETVTGDDTTVQYVIHFGRLIDVRRDPPEDTEQQLVDQLLSTGRIDEEDLERAEVLASINDIPVQDALVDMGRITLEQLLDAIKGCLIDEFEGLWELDADEMRLYRLERRPPLRLRRSSIDLVEQLVGRVRRRLAGLSNRQLEDKKDRFSGERLRRRSPLPFAIDRLGLDRRQRRFVEVVLDEPRSLFELDRISNLRDAETIRMLVLLDELGIVQRVEKSSRLPEHSEIEGLYEGLATKTHFEVLGVHWSAYDEEIEQARRTIQEKLDVPEQVERDMSEQLQQLRRAVSEAYATLADPKHRRAYRNEQIDRYARKSALNVYENQVDSLSMREDKTELIDCLSRIVELDPSNEKARRQLEALKHAQQRESVD